MMNNEILETVLKYNALGLATFPIKPRTKIGFYRYEEFRGEPNNKWPEGSPFSWKAQASNDPERSRRYWTDHPDANIGIATGMISGGLIVLDFDEDEEQGKHGLEVLKDWEEKYGSFPETARVITGRGGIHLLFHYDKPIKGTEAIYPGVDVRAEGNYILAPPSIHPNGRSYQWEAGYEPF